MNFSPRRLAAIARKEFLHVLRDWRSLALALAIPMLLIWLFGYALTMDLKNAPTAVWDQSHTPASRDFLHQLDGSPYFVIRQLISTPVRVPELVIGKVVLYFVIGLTDVAIAVLMGRFIFHVPLRGNPALLFAMASVFLCGALFLGLVLSIVLKTQVLANQLAIFANYLPTLLLSGFVFSIHKMHLKLEV